MTWIIEMHLRLRLRKTFYFTWWVKISWPVNFVYVCVFRYQYPTMDELAEMLPSVLTQLKWVTELSQFVQNYSLPLRSLWEPVLCKNQPYRHAHNGRLSLRKELKEQNAHIVSDRISVFSFSGWTVLLAWELEQAPTSYHVLLWVFQRMFYILGM